MRRSRTSRARRPNYRARRLVVALATAFVSVLGMIGVTWQERQGAPRDGGSSPQSTVRGGGSGGVPQSTAPQPQPAPRAQQTRLARELLAELPRKGRAPKTDYRRTQFGNGWQQFANGCDVRNDILRRDLRDVVVDARCKVQRGTLHDPYTDKTITFMRGPHSSDKIQIDHVVALSNAWQTGAQQLPFERRVALANDPMNLLAVEGAANQEKGDADAATWLPPHKAYRCPYVARQISVKHHYSLWVTPGEAAAMERVLQGCPDQPALAH